jgi:hypothetical protein
VSSRLLDPKTNPQGQVTGGNDKQPPKKKVRVVTAAQDLAARLLEGLYNALKTEYPFQAIHDVFGNAVVPLGGVRAGADWTSADEDVKGICKQVQEKWDGEGVYSAQPYDKRAVPWMRKQVDELTQMPEAPVGAVLGDIWRHLKELSEQAREEFKAVVEADMTNLRAMFQALSTLMDTDVLWVDAP